MCTGGNALSIIISAMATRTPTRTSFLTRRVPLPWCSTCIAVSKRQSVPSAAPSIHPCCDVIDPCDTSSSSIGFVEAFMRSLTAPYGVG